MTNPIIPVSSAAITDSNGRLTIAGRDFLRQLLSKQQTQIDDLTTAEGHITDLLASLTDSDGNLLDLSALNVDELAAIAAVQLPGFMYRDALGQWYGCTLDGQAAAASGNVTIIAPATHAATSKATPVDADELPLVDSAASNGLKKLTWLNLLNAVWTRLGGLIAGGTAKTTPASADTFAICDSAASNATKKLTWANLLANIPTGGGSIAALDPIHEQFFVEEFTRGINAISTASGAAFVTAGSVQAYNVGGTTGTGSVVADAVFGSYFIASTGASATGLLRLFVMPGPRAVFGGGLVRVGTAVRLPVLSTALQRYQFDFGFRSVLSGAGDNLFVSYVDNVNSGFWRLTSTVGGVTTNVDTATVGPAANTKVRLELEINAAGTSCDLIVDGTVVATTTAIPAVGVGLQTSITKSVGTTAVTAEIAYMAFRQTFTTAR